MKHIVLTLTMALLTGIYPLLLNAGTISVSGSLSKEITSTTNTAAITVRDCDGNVISTIPSEAVTTTKYEPYAKSGQTLRFTVTRLENPEVAIVTIDTNINNINYNASDGQFSVDLTRSVIIESRYNYKVKARISENSYASVIFEREYSIAPAGSGSAFPIGSVIAYLGNNGNIEGMEANGWFKCKGQLITSLTALSADEQTALMNILGGSSNLPDLRAMFLRGVDDAKGLDNNVGTRTGGESTTGVRSFQGDEFKSHDHTGSADQGGDHTHSYVDAYYSENNGGSTNQKGSGDSDNDNEDWTKTRTTGGSGTHGHSITIDPRGGAETRPENIAVYWLIRGR